MLRVHDFPKLAQLLLSVVDKEQAPTSGHDEMHWQRCPQVFIHGLDLFVCSRARSAPINC